MALSVIGYSQANDVAGTPSAEFLEFLIEFSETDDETFTMLVENGVRDAEQAQTKAESVKPQDEVNKVGDKHEES